MIYALTDTSAAASGGARHVPFRDSKLTRMLQDSLVRHDVFFEFFLCRASVASDSMFGLLINQTRGARLNMGSL